MIRKHPDADFLLEYATGALPLAPCIAVTTHLSFCDQCQRTVESLKEIGGSLLETSGQQSVSEHLLAQVFARIEQNPDFEPRPKGSLSTDSVCGMLPRYVQHLLPAGELSWRSLSKSVRVAPVSVGEQRYELALHRIDTGGQAPHHDHGGQEITVVLQGSFSDENGLYQMGDFIVREPGEAHQPAASKNAECICLSVLAAPIRLTGIKRVLNPFISFSPS